MKNVKTILVGISLLSASCLSQAFTPAKVQQNAFGNGLTAVEASETVSTKLNINSASANELIELPGIGKKKAAQIIEYRELNGDFQTVEELMNVKGIGMKMLAKLTDLIEV